MMMKITRCKVNLKGYITKVGNSLTSESRDQSRFRAASEGKHLVSHWLSIHSCNILSTTSIFLIYTTDLQSLSVIFLPFAISYKDKQLNHSNNMESETGMLNNIPYTWQRGGSDGARDQNVKCSLRVLTPRKRELAPHPPFPWLEVNGFLAPEADHSFKAYTDGHRSAFCIDILLKIM